MSVVASETLVAKQNKTGTSVLFHTVLSLMRPNRARWMLVVLLVLVQSASQLAPPIYYKLIFNRVVGGGDAGALPPLAAGMAAVFGVMVVVALVQASLCAELGMRAVNQLRSTLVQHIHRLDIDYFGRVRTGDVLARFSGDIGAIERIMTWSLHQIARDGLAALLCIAALFFVEWHLAALTLAMLPLVALIPRSIGRRAAVAGHARREDDGRLTSAVQETFAGHRVIRAFSIEQRHGQQFRALLQSVHANGRRANLLSALVEKSSDFGLLFTQLVIIGLGGYLVTRGFLTAGDLIAFFGLLLNASDALYGLSTLVPDFIQASTASRRIDELLAEAPEPGAARDAIGAPRLSQEIRFADVGFSYGKSVAVERASFVVGAGQSVALVGRSGSGKSTILSLIMRFHDPTIGKITVDGRDLASIDPASWRAQIGCVFQSTFLFDLSVRENIRQGRLDASDAAVESAARAAMIHENILELPQGYDTLLGESGGRLSGGQQQRLALARAILRDPAILILDEPTSALDPLTEAAINLTLDALARNRTRILVTHRLAAAVSMDRILVFDQGRLIEQGTHQQLLGQGGTYWSMWQKQSHLVIDSSGTRARLNAMFLQTVPIFEELSEELLNSLADQFGSELHEADVKIVEQGEIGEKFYVIVRGRVEVLVRHAALTANASGILEDGDFFGEIALLTNSPRTATIRSLDRCLLLTLTRAQFQSVIAREPHLRTGLEAVVAQRLASDAKGM